jgi:hypothetical protein
LRNNITDSVAQLWQGPLENVQRPERVVLIVDIVRGANVVLDELREDF